MRMILLFLIMFVNNTNDLSDVSIMKSHEFREILKFRLISYTFRHIVRYEK